MFTPTRIWFVDFAHTIAVIVADDTGRRKELLKNV